MKFDFEKSLAILNATPEALNAQLKDLPLDWTSTKEAEDKWSVFDVVGHLVHGEKTDWIERTKIILSNSEDKTFTPFNRFAQEKDSVGKSLEDLLNEFQKLRIENIKTISQLIDSETDFLQKGTHPALGEVNLSQLLATWTVHDLGHIAQINRIMAKQYKAEVGPWKAYLRIIN